MARLHKLEPYYNKDGIIIYHGDCREILPQFVEQVDHVITDPPFRRDLYLSFRANAGKRQGTYGADHRALANQEIGALEDVLDVAAVEFTRLTHRWIIIFHDAESGHLWRNKLTGLYVRTGIWVKTNPMPQISGDRPGQGFEMLTIAHGKGRKHWNGGGFAAIWIFKTENASGTKLLHADHPSPKPIALMRELVRQFTDEGERILDPFMGSGTTLLAAKQLGRKAIGIELQEKWCKVAVERLEMVRQRYRHLTKDGNKLLDRGYSLLD